MTTRADIVTEARRWLGTPYLHQGRALGLGVDCLGLVVGVARALGYAVDETPDYGRSPDGRLRPALDRHLIRKPDLSIDPGDVLLFRIRREPQHVGIATGPTAMIHAFDSAAIPAKVREQPLDAQTWLPRLLAVYAWPGVR